MILIQNSQRDLPLSVPKLRKAISFLLQQLLISTDQVSFHFVTERKIIELHREFFNDPSPTDCITFPLDGPVKRKEDFHVLGEAFICPLTALKYSKSRNLPPLEELYRYIIHCLLHLIGYTDQLPKERAKMKRKERELLHQLKQHGWIPSAAS